jgi:adenylate kinase
VSAASEPLRLVFLGAPGAGKGTQAANLAKAHGLAHLSTGDMLRKAAADGTPVGLRVQPILQSGALVSDDVMWSVVDERLDQPDLARGYILDGFPRTVPQAQMLDGKLAAQRRGLSAVVLIDVPEEALVTRLSARGRADDKPEVIRERLKNYALLTEPLKDWYRAKGLLRAIDGTGTPEQVFARLEAAVGAPGR